MLRQKVFVLCWWRPPATDDHTLLFCLLAITIAIAIAAPIMRMAIFAMSAAANAKSTRTDAPPNAAAASTAMNSAAPATIESGIMAIPSRACSAVFEPAATDVPMNAGAAASDDAADAIVSCD